MLTLINNIDSYRLNYQHNSIRGGAVNERKTSSNTSYRR
jgi:hypothetical protein